MKLRSIEIDGFGSFADKFSRDFPEGVLYIYGTNFDNPDHADSNGAGKTTLLDAVSWALYGRTPSGRTKDACINDSRDSVRVHLSLCGLYVERWKDRNKSESVRFTVRDQSPIRGDLEATNEELQRHIGVSFETFCNTIYLTRSSKTVRFLDTTPSKRSKVLAEMVDDLVFRLAAELILKDLNEGKEERTRTLTLLTQIVQQQEMNQKDVLRIKQQIQEFNETDLLRRKRIAEKMNNLKARYKRVENVLDEKPEFSMEELQINKEKLRIQIEEQLNKKAILKAAAATLDPNLEEGCRCPTCNSVLTEDDVIELVGIHASAVDEIKNIEDRLINLKDCIREIEEDQNKVRDWRTRQASARNEAETLRVEYSQLKDEMQPAKTDHLNRLVAELEVRGKELLERENALKKRVADINKREPYLKQLRKAFNTDIRNFMLDKVRGALTYYSNYYAACLAGDEFTISYPHESSAGTEKFEITLTSAGVERPLEAWSEGERWRATFAVLLALRRVALESNASPVQFLLIDDPIGALDETGAARFAELIGEMSDATNTQILCTLPRELELCSDYGEILHVERKRKVSYVASS